MHEYLNPGFRFLMAGKANAVRLTITDTNPGNPHGEDYKGKIIFHSPHGRMCKLMGSLNLPQRIRRINIRYNFADFIQKEMGVVQE